MAHLYYADSETVFSPGAVVTVTGSEARHAVKVARLRVAESVWLGDGHGTLTQARVTHTGADTFTAECGRVWIDSPPLPRFVLVQALAKGDRAERAVEQATEYGVSAICFWQAERSVSRWNSSDKITKGRQKWQRIAREAAKQATRGHIPPVGEFRLSEFDEAGGESSHNPVFVLHPGADLPLSAALRTRVSNHPLPETITFVVGPEGGLSQRECDEFVRRGASLVKLGDTVLRTSSAGAAALAVAHTVCGTW